MSLARHNSNPSCEAVCSSRTVMLGRFDEATVLPGKNPEPTRTHCGFDSPLDKPSVLHFHDRQPPVLRETAWA